MTVSVSCKACKSTLKVPEQLAGKKVKCPKCAGVVAVPAVEEEEFVAVEVMPRERIKAAPAKKVKPVSRRDDDEEDEDEDEVERRRTRIKTGRDRDDDRRSSRYREEDDDDRRRSKKRYEDEEDDDDDRGRGKKRDQFKPCPRCGARGAKRVLWTAWGSFYGPALFNHVRCPDCSYCYNGKSGRSNALAATVFVSVPLLGIGAIIGAIFYMLIQRNYL